MDMIKQLIIILGACFAGEVISALLPIAFPSSVIAMLLLFLLLLCGALKEQHISKVGDFFLQNMTIFFLPSAIGILEHWGVISGILVQFLLICLLTTLLTFAATAYTVMLVRKWMKRGESHD
ncbi:MAG: CidA/LrgA family protein [Oscillospiraceae bacterium]|nr:CidA/LrgA family protein [Oscillospiraceae bacterium]